MTPDYTKVFINGLRLEMSIGIREHEKKKTQPVIVDLEATVSLHGKDDKDKIPGFVCYETISNNIRALTQQGHINLVETLAERIARSCLGDERILDVKVKVGKPDAIDDVACVGVEIFRKR